MNMKFSTPRTLVLISIIMFGFGFLLVPLYSVFCELTGINGKTAGIYQGSYSHEPVFDRQVKIQFISNQNANMNWPFKAREEQVEVHLGEKRKVIFNVTNATNSVVVTQAVPSVSPSEAAPYLHKIECFCFQQQTLEIGENKDMPLVFFIDKKLPGHIKKLTLSYTLYDVTKDHMKMPSS